MWQNNLSEVEQKALFQSMGKPLVISQNTLMQHYPQYFLK